MTLKTSVYLTLKLHLLFFFLLGHNLMETAPGLQP